MKDICLFLELIDVGMTSKGNFLFKWSHVLLCENISTLKNNAEIAV
jgi:hypothetical protein